MFIFTVFTLTSGHSNKSCGCALLWPAGHWGSALGPRPSVRRINGSLIIDQEEKKILQLATKQLEYKVWKSDSFYDQCTHWPSAEQSAESKTSDGRNWWQHGRWASIDNSVSAAMEKTLNPLRSFLWTKPPCPPPDLTCTFSVRPPELFSKERTSPPVRANLSLISLQQSCQVNSRTPDISVEALETFCQCRWTRAASVRPRQHYVFLRFNLSIFKRVDWYHFLWVKSKSPDHSIVTVCHSPDIVSKVDNYCWLIYTRGTLINAWLPPFSRINHYDN